MHQSLSQPLPKELSERVQHSRPRRGAKHIETDEIIEMTNLCQIWVIKYVLVQKTLYGHARY